jgi:hypothetical protein
MADNSAAFIGKVSDSPRRSETAVKGQAAAGVSSQSSGVSSIGAAAAQESDKASLIRDQCWLRPKPNGSPPANAPSVMRTLRYASRIYVEWRGDRPSAYRIPAP